MARSTDAQENRLAELKKEVTKRGFDRHASRLKNISELPIELRSPAVMELATQQIIQTIIIFPQQIQRGWHYVPKQALLFTAAGVIHLLASIWPDEEPQLTCLKGCGLMYMRVTLQLLYGLLEIVAQGEDSPTRLGMEFNTVAWYILSAPLQQLLGESHLREISCPPVRSAAYSPIARQALEKLPFKFANGVRLYGLLPGEDLKEVVFQPGIWKPWLHFFRRAVTADTLLMLTTNYMVAIQEDLNVRQGWIISYIPRNCIWGIQSRPLGLWNELSVQLERGSQMTDFKLLLARDSAEVWCRQWIQHGGHWFS